MRMRTTEVSVGETYTFRWGVWDDLNRLIYAKYPARARWVVEGDDRSYKAASPSNGASVEVVAKEVAFLDRRGNLRRTSNYRGRPFVLVRDAAGATYVPIDPQNLYPAGEIPDVRRSWLAVAGWLVAIAVMFVTLAVAVVWLAGPPEGSDPIPIPIGVGSLAVSAVILGASIWWLVRQLTERRSEGILNAALRTGLVVGAALAVAALLRQALGLGG